MVCLEVNHENQPECCGFLRVCTTRDVWLRLRNQVNDTLSAITLADLIQPKSDHPAYTIVQRPTEGPETPLTPAAAAATLPARGIPGRHRTRRRTIPQQPGTSEVTFGDNR